MYGIIGAATIYNYNIADNRLQTFQRVGNYMSFIPCNDDNRDIHAAKKQ